MLAFVFGIVTIFGLFQAKDDAVHYQIRPMPVADRTNLEISVLFKPEDGNPVKITLPTDSYGTPDLYRYVTSFEGKSGTVVRPGKEVSERIVEPGPKGEIQLEYVISYDPKTLDGTYSPNVSSKYFHVYGCQWALQIGEFEQKHHLIIETVGIPKNWQIYSSLGPNPQRVETTASLQNLIQTVIGGGEKQDFRQFNFHDKPVTVFIPGSFNIPSGDIFNAVQKIVTLQRTWFNDYSQPFYNVAVLPRKDNVAGQRIKNAFICFFKQDITRDQLFVLMSHEMFHNWLDSGLIKPDEGVSSLRYAWFYEGVNDYFARKFLLDAGLLSRGKFAYLINRDIINIADNPHRSATFDDLINAVKTGKYNQAFNKLSYYRGALIALNWESRIQKSGKGHSLGDLIRELYQLASKNDGLTEQQFFELAEGYGIDAKGDLENYILRGEPIKIDSDSLGNLFKLSDSLVPSFDLGFTLGESLKNKRIIGLREDSPAFKAGLRNGMKLVEVENANRFGNAWDPDKPFVALVENNGVNRRIQYFPHGDSFKLLLFKPIGNHQ